MNNVAALLISTLRELGGNCSYVESGRACGREASPDATGRFLCPKHTRRVSEKRIEQAERNRARREPEPRRRRGLFA